MPLEGTSVFHPDWSAHHRPTATDSMTAACTVRHPDATGAVDDQGDWTPSAAITVYTGPCRLQLIGATNERIEVAGESQTTVRRYLVAVRYDTAQIDTGDEVEITEAVDAGAAGMTLRVVDVQYGSEQWQRDLICEETYDQDGARQ